MIGLRVCNLLLSCCLGRIFMNSVSNCCGVVSGIRYVAPTLTLKIIISSQVSSSSCGFQNHNTLYKDSVFQLLFLTSSQMLESGLGTNYVDWALL